MFFILQVGHIALWSCQKWGGGGGGGGRASCHIGGSVEGGVFKPSAHNALCQVNLRAIIFHCFWICFS